MCMLLVLADDASWSAAGCKSRRCQRQARGDELTNGASARMPARRCRVSYTLNCNSPAPEGRLCAPRGRQGCKGRNMALEQILVIAQRRRGSLGGCAPRSGRV